MIFFEILLVLTILVIFMKETIRTFIAVPIHDSVKKSIADLQRELTLTKADVKWVRPGNVHITLKFLGDVETDRIAEVSRKVEDAARSFGRFSIRIGGTGAFPNARRPHVLWIGVQEGANPLIELSARIDSAMVRIGFEKEKRPFSPHLTIGRVRSMQNVREAVDLMQRSAWNTEPFDAETVVVMKSDLQSTGAAYTPLATIKLQG